MSEASEQSGSSTNSFRRLRATHERRRRIDIWSVFDGELRERVEGE
ncbi:hypothetical protein [Halorubrum lacusprofundi]|nr:hypothetical protein [Halorubrum lacusprofundi]MCG1006062.1 hypothetical protein [Halorubrum lacusprofundi]